MKRPARPLSAVLGLVLGAATVTVVAASAGATAASDNASAAVDRLRADAEGSLKIVRTRSGDVRFVGTAAGGRVDNPAVRPSSSVKASADAHLARYGAALGATRPGTSLRQHRTLTTDVGFTVRYRQEVGGLPVLGGDVVVSMGEDHELGSLLSTMSDAAPVPAATLSAAAAAASARLVAGEQGVEAATTAVEGRWLLDPDVIGLPSDVGPRGVFRVNVRAGHEVDRDVFVDDRTGDVLLAVDNHHAADRVVCDLNSALQNPNAADPPCDSGFARVEGQAPVGIADVDDVYTFVGATSDLYQSIGVDLTDMIGKDFSGTKRIASTVRLCYSPGGSGNCPYPNAFWNGTEMYYGTGLTVDDVTGHELTHGVTDRTSELIYWGQSGAINESISDIMGEIVDHRTATSGDSPTDWQLAEQSSIGAIRNLADPTLKNDPDKTSSSLYVRDLGNNLFYNDNGGVHSNSGVSNKTAYLIMEGGTFNGQTVVGIDGGDTFPKTARLYQLVNESMASGADFADLGLVLVQACNSLVGSNGFTADDCTNVQKATVATELSQTPALAPQPADAPSTCPGGQTRTVLFDSESGTPSTKFTSTAANWLRTDDPYWGSNAHSGQDSWNNATPISSAAMTAKTESLVAANPIAVPSTGTTYLHFQGWYSLHFTLFQPSGAYGEFRDGGTVEIDDLGDASPPVDVAGQTWVNGPNRVIAATGGNPAAGRTAFGGDSEGWVASRLDLSSFAGKSIKPQFSVNYNNSFTYIGWFLDDITVYHCGVPTAPVVNAGPDVTATVGTPFSSAGSFTDAFPEAASATVDFGDGAGAQPLPLTGSTFGLAHTYTTAGAKTVTVTVTDAESLSASDTMTVTVSPAPPPAVLNVVAGTVDVTGKLLVGKKLKAKVAGWAPADVIYTYQWLRNGKAIKGATEKKYKLTGKDKGKKLQVVVTASKPGYTPASVTSKKTKKIKDE